MMTVKPVGSVRPSVDLVSFVHRCLFKYLHIKW